jgi:hypothetical protein
MTLAEETQQPNTLELATDLTIAWLSNPNTTASADDVSAFLQKMHSAIAGIGSGAAAEEEPAAKNLPRQCLFANHWHPRSTSSR